jgi:hypothetical protein
MSRSARRQRWHILLDCFYVSIILWSLMTNECHFTSQCRPVVYCFDISWINIYINDGSQTNQIHITCRRYRITCKHQQNMTTTHYQGDRPILFSHLKDTLFNNIYQVYVWERYDALFSREVIITSEYTCFQKARFSEQHTKKKIRNVSTVVYFFKAMTILIFHLLLSRLKIAPHVYQYFLYVVHIVNRGVGSLIN